MNDKVKKKAKKKEHKHITVAMATVNSSFNNTLITFADMSGNVFAWSSSGVVGFKGSRKSTPFAAQLAAEDAGRKAMEFGVKTIDIQVCGPGAGRESAIRSLRVVGLNINTIKDITPIPHNGCRPKKRRRV